ncbi:hypothetical protein Hanom_Chr01g00029811 [Helianthus anomalus]
MIGRTGSMWFGLVWVGSRSIRTDTNSKHFKTNGNKKLDGLVSGGFGRSQFTGYAAAPE